MKKGITILFLIALTVSCADAKKSKAILKVGQTKNDTYLKATIDGAIFYIESPSYFYDSTDKLISITAMSKDRNKIIRVSLDYNKGPATYTLGKDTASMIYTIDKVHWMSSKSRGKGHITLREEGGYLLGEFSFTGENIDEITKEITDGEFRVKNKLK